MVTSSAVSSEPAGTSLRSDQTGTVSSAAAITRAPTTTDAATSTTPTASRGSRHRDDRSLRTAGTGPTSGAVLSRVDGAPSPPTLTMGSHPVRRGVTASPAGPIADLRELLCRFSLIRPPLVPSGSLLWGRKRDFDCGQSAMVVLVLAHLSHATGIG